MSVTRGVLRALLIAALASCEAEPDPTRATTVDVLVESDPGVRLADVPIHLDGAAVGRTDSRGSLRAQVPAGSDSSLRLEHECPSSHQAPSEPKILRLGFSDDPDLWKGAPLQITLRCKPKKRRAVFIVRATNGPGLPVLLDGKPIAQTNSSGITHFSTSAPPGTDFLVRLDTETRPDLRPKNPNHLRALTDSDRIFLIDQVFEPRRKPRRKRSPRARITKIE